MQYIMTLFSLRNIIFCSMLSYTISANNILADELPPTPEGAFSIVIIPDTQHYKGHGTKAEPDSKDPVTNPVFEKWTDWIAANLDRQRVAFVSHVGDIVDKNEKVQWAIARSCMDKIHGKVPYGITVGNHDMRCGPGDSTLFQDVFPKLRFESFDWYAGCFTNPDGNTALSGNNANSIQLFEAAGMKFVALHIECNAPDDVLAWADSVLEKYKDRRAIITTHMDLGPAEKPVESGDYFNAPKGRMNWKKCHGERGNTPVQMWEKCFRKHKNLFMLCSGDQSRTQAYRLTTIGDHGNTVHAVVSDYGGYGLRVMRFIPSQNLIEVRTWDPIKGKLCETTKVVPDREQHQFTLNYGMSKNK